MMYADLTYGTFSTNLTPEYRFGLHFAVKMGGVVMDIDKIAHTTVERNNDKDKLSAYNLSRGPSYSLNENLVPEQLFDDPDTPEKEADGISAVKALTLAAQQGQTIYTITKANYAEVLPKLNHSDVVMTDIRNGVNAGRTVTVHDTQMSFNGWKGTGYTILDPVSGAGAYMIGGGLDGGWININAALSYLMMVFDNFRGYVETLAKIVRDTDTVNFLKRLGNKFDIIRALLTLTSIPFDCADYFKVLASVASLIALQMMINSLLLLLPFVGWALLIGFSIVLVIDIVFTIIINSVISEKCTVRGENK